MFIYWEFLGILGVGRACPMLLLFFFYPRHTKSLSNFRLYLSREDRFSSTAREHVGGPSRALLYFLFPPLLCLSTWRQRPILDVRDNLSDAQSLYYCVEIVTVSAINSVRMACIYDKNQIKAAAAASADQNRRIPASSRK